MLFFAYKLFKNHNVPLILMTIFIKVLPILMLAMIDTFIFKTKMTFNKGLGIFIIICGIILMEM
jgi:drug/metabolite transporter (DMT)-like permease